MSRGHLPYWSNSWKLTLCDYMRQSRQSKQLEISTPGVYSDVLYQPYLCAMFNPATLINNQFKSNIANIPADGLGPQHLQRWIETGQASGPIILLNLMDSWPCYQGPQKWSLESLAKQYPKTIFRAESILCTLETYKTYESNCQYDESPLYLFDSDFVEKTKMGNDYTPPDLFSDDLFKVMGDQRPDYRWVVCFYFNIDYWTSWIRFKLAQRSKWDCCLECSRNWV